jgi:hypothetical protein
MANIMKNFEEEHDLARLYQDEFNQDFEFLKDDQVKALRKKAKDWYALSRRHTYRHNALNIILILSLLALDYLAFRFQYFENAWANIFVTFIMHSYIAYSATIFTMHEGAGHRMLILGKSKIATFTATLANNVGRLFYNDPGFYGPIHIHHHKDFGTDKDAAFTNYVLTNRIVKCFLPLAGILPFCDYKIHGDTKFNKSQLLSNFIGIIYTIWLCRPFIQEHGRVFFIIFFLTCGWLSFTLDRMRETTEHHLMPVDEMNGARSFGLGFWGLTIGGGPWGQPSHLAHHVHPSLPWYWQCKLHFEFKRIFTEKQKEQFLFDKLMDYPKLVKEIYHGRKKVESFYQTSVINKA